MLPSSKSYLQKGGMSPRAATGVMVGCFLAGAFGIAILSQILHRYIPHSVVDCNHEHSDEEEGKAVEDETDQHEPHSPPAKSPANKPSVVRQLNTTTNGRPHSSYGTTSNSQPLHQLTRRPSLHATLSTKVTQLVTGSKQFCDEHGQCFGYTDPCGSECFRNVHHNRPPRLLHSASGKLSTRPSGLRTQTMPNEHMPLLHGDNDNNALTPTVSGPATMESSLTSLPSMNGHSIQQRPSQQSIGSHRNPSSSASSSTSSHLSHSHQGHQHHHHVPTNVFLSIGLQTSTAIALHKIPEGFITYATNHANPRLGFSIFLALFIHNITEGFALALPLYLAINSRWKAMFWSALLGGVSQPLGAGVAALWFKIAKRGAGEGTGEPGETVYGAMFAVTAGIMAMVSLQLFGESLDLTHSRKLCFIGAFAGMGILGVSSALTA
jgi:zinc transporter ZupT